MSSSPAPGAPAPEPRAPRRPGRGTIVAASALAVALGGGLIACGQGSASGSPAPDVSVTDSATTRPGKDTAGRPMKRSKPVRLAVPSAGVDASPVLDLGLDANQELQVPSVAQAERPGWYTGSVTPGEKGASVLVAHYDTAEGPALMRNVARVRTGDLIEVGRADGTTAEFRIREIQQVDKKAFPTRKVYGATDRPELRLITCGGPIEGGHRADNIILYADLVR
ncbi:class F sortase [Streptomyces sp. NPDC001941]|uniref:class F sortase n=1 Tax=Streptomyces sp. NPDC001941 TaxID=3154659 RepID=UPI00332D5077